MTPVNDPLDYAGERNIVVIVVASHRSPAGDLSEIGNKFRPLGAAGRHNNDNLRFDSDL